jgi:hypothetical protein
VALVDGAGNELSFTQVDDVAVADRQTVELGRLELPFVFRQARFRVAMGAPVVGPCSEEEVRVTRVEGAQCLPFRVTGVFDDDGEPLAALACSRFPCQHAATDHILDNLPDGQYVLQVLGYQAVSDGGTALCYQTEPLAFAVSGGDAELGTLAAPLDPTLDPEERCE